jgi:alkylhydroperoxidase/carboxymuconolactone decarboxylase family protein YurZ
MLSYTDRLRLLALNDAAFVHACASGTARESWVLDAKEVALIRLAALIAVGGAQPSYGELVDAAFDAGVTAAEMVDALVHLIPVVGVPRVVGAAPKLGLALGYDIDAALEE